MTTDAALLAKLTELETENRLLSDRLAALEGSSSRVGTGPETNRETSPATSPSTPMSRRRLLRRVGSGAAVLGIGAIGASLANLGTTSPAQADGEPIVLGSTLTDASAETTIRNHVNDNDVFFAASSGAGIGVHGYSASNAGVSGDTLSGIGVHGVSFGDGVGFGVRGDSVANIAVVGASQSGIGVQGISQSDEGVEGGSGSGDGVHGFSDTGNGVSGYTSGRLASGVTGHSTSSTGGIGVSGDAAGGRGGVFKGGLAQVQLVASSASSHPASGVRGDLFVDKSGRLWFCKGGRTWKQLA